jgi:hypothetical protein
MSKSGHSFMPSATWMMAVLTVLGIEAIQEIQDE